MLEQLRQEMIQAFHRYAGQKPDKREIHWQTYLQARELYLSESAKAEKKEYVPLRFQLDPGEGH